MKTIDDLVALLKKKKYKMKPLKLFAQALEGSPFHVDAIRYVLELDRRRVFKHVYGKRISVMRHKSVSGTTRVKAPDWLHEYAHANDLHSLGKIDFCIDYILTNFPNEGKRHRKSDS